MGKKKRHYRMPKWRKYARAGVALGGKAIGAIVALSPTYRGVQHMFSDPAAGAADVLFDVTGISPGTGPDINKLAQTGFTIGGGFLIMWIAGQIARRI